jgi:hypothetical protein
MSWSGYYQKVSAPNRLMVGAFIEHVRCRDAALDLGAGNLRDSKLLQRLGFKRIVAVDSSPESRTFLVPGIELQETPIERYRPEINTFSFAFSCHTLFLLKPSQVYTVFERVWYGLQKDGVFACNLMGPNADWVKTNQAHGFEEAGIDRLAEPFEILRQSRYQGTKPGMSGKVRYWDIWELVLRKS